METEFSSSPKHMIYLPSPITIAGGLEIQQEFLKLHLKLTPLCEGQFLLNWNSFIDLFAGHADLGIAHLCLNSPTHYAF